MSPVNELPADLDSEMLDLVDGANRVIGRVKRAEVHGNPVLEHRAVHVIVRNAKGEIYLQKRISTKKIQPGKWDSSVGGHVPAEAGYEESALRELEEELTVKLESTAALKFSHEYVWRSEIETEHVRTYILVSEGPFRPNPAEISEGRFWSVPELRSALGTGVLTPNLEEELRHLGLI